MLYFDKWDVSNIHNCVVTMTALVPLVYWYYLLTQVVWKVILWQTAPKIEYGKQQKTSKRVKAVLYDQILIRSVTWPQLHRRRFPVTKDSTCRWLQPRPIIPFGDFILFLSFLEEERSLIILYFSHFVCFWKQQSCRYPLNITLKAFSPLLLK